MVFCALGWRRADGKGHTAQMVEGNVSIIAITNSQISQEHVKAWTGDVAEEWRSHKRFRFIHASIPESQRISVVRAVC